MHQLLYVRYLLYHNYIFFIYIYVHLYRDKHLYRPPFCLYTKPNMWILFWFREWYAKTMPLTFFFLYFYAAILFCLFCLSVMLVWVVFFFFLSSEWWYEMVYCSMVATHSVTTQYSLAQPITSFFETTWVESIFELNDNFHMEKYLYFSVIFFPRCCMDVLCWHGVGWERWNGYTGFGWVCIYVFICDNITQCI